MISKTKIFDKLRHELRIPQILHKINENNAILNELYWANVFNNTIVGSSWFTNQGISPGRWAIGYPVFYVMYRLLNEVKPVNILEFGLGQSSKMLHKYAAWNSSAKITTIEHDENWIEFFLKNNDIPTNCRIAKHENEEIELFGHKTLSIKDLKQTTQNEIYDFIFVDSPFGSLNYSRPQILQLIEYNLNWENFCIIIDDHNRIGEKETSLKLESVLRALNVKFRSTTYKGEKELVIHCSTNLSYLLSL